MRPPRRSGLERMTSSTPWRYHSMVVALFAGGNDRRPPKSLARWCGPPGFVAVPLLPTAAAPEKAKKVLGHPSSPSQFHVSIWERLSRLCAALCKGSASPRSLTCCPAGLPRPREKADRSKAQEAHSPANADRRLTKVRFGSVSRPAHFAVQCRKMAHAAARPVGRIPPDRCRKSLHLYRIFTQIGNHNAQ